MSEIGLFLMKWMLCLTICNIYLVIGRLQITVKGLFANVILMNLLYEC